MLAASLGNFAGRRRGTIMLESLGAVGWWLQAAALFLCSAILFTVWMRRKSIQHRDQPKLSARGEV